jgi:hypothetical protein
VTNVLTLAADGAQSEETQSVGPDGATRLHQATVSLQDGTVMLVDWQRRIVSTTNDEASSWRHRLRSPASKCLSFINGKPAPGALMGQDKVGDHVTVHVGSAERSAWYAIDLQCAPVKQASQAGVQVANDVSSGPLTNDVATLPSGFREVPPSEFYGLPSGSADAQARDAYYRLHHRQ